MLSIKQGLCQPVRYPGASTPIPLQLSPCPASAAVREPYTFINDTGTRCKQPWHQGQSGVNKWFLARHTPSQQCSVKIHQLIRAAACTILHTALPHNTPPLALHIFPPLTAPPTGAMLGGQGACTLCEQGKAGDWGALTSPYICMAGSRG